MVDTMKRYERDRDPEFPTPVEQVNDERVSID